MSDNGIDVNDVQMEERHPRQLPTRTILLILGTLVLVVAAVVVGISNRAATTSTDDATTVTEQDLTPLEQVDAQCQSSATDNWWRQHVLIGDEGRTMIIETEGEEEDGIGWDKLMCIVNGLEASDSWLAQFGATRALDGTQHGGWDGYSATWSYHPRSGATLVIEEDAS